MKEPRIKQKEMTKQEIKKLTNRESDGRPASKNTQVYWFSQGVLCLLFWHAEPPRVKKGSL